MYTYKELTQVKTKTNPQLNENLGNTYSSAVHRKGNMNGH